MKFVSFFQGLLACISREDFMNFTLRIVESSVLMMRKQSLALQKPVSQHVFIFDMEGFSVKVSTFNMTDYINGEPSHVLYLCLKDGDFQNSFVIFC